MQTSEQTSVESRIDKALAQLANTRIPTPLETRSAEPSLVNIPASPDREPTNDERREHPRRDSSSRVTMSFGLMDVSDPAWNFRSTPHGGQLLDLSMRGAAFESEQPAMPNTVVALRLEGGTLDEGHTLRAKIVRCDTLDEGYRIVCRFQEDLSLEDLYQYSRHRFSHPVV